MGGVALAMFMIIALSGIGIYVLLKSMQNFKPGRNKIQQDLKQIKAELQPWVADLVPWSREEMEQLSLQQMNRSSRKGVVRTAKGIFTTIYHEPVIAWSYRKYLSPSENALLYVRTSDNEFIYRIKNQEVEMVIGNILVGTLRADGVLYSAKGNKQLAQINPNSEELLLPVKVNEKRVGSLTNPNKSDKANARAFQYLSDMNKEEEQLFMALSILEMTRKNM
jgi:hypothetical protein